MRANSLPTCGTTRLIIMTLKPEVPPEEVEPWLVTLLNLFGKVRLKWESVFLVVTVPQKSLLFTPREEMLLDNLRKMYLTNSDEDLYMQNKRSLYKLFKFI